MRERAKSRADVMLGVFLLLLVCCAVVTRSMHYPAHLSKWNGAGGHRGMSTRSNGLEMEKLSGVDLVASSAVQEESKRENIMKFCAINSSFSLLENVAIKMNAVSEM